MWALFGWGKGPEGEESIDTGLLGAKGLEGSVNPAGTGFIKGALVLTGLGVGILRRVPVPGTAELLGNMIG